MTAVSTTQEEIVNTGRKIRKLTGYRLDTERGTRTVKIMPSELRPRQIWEIEIEREAGSEEKREACRIKWLRQIGSIKDEADRAEEGNAETRLEFWHIGDVDTGRRGDLPRGEPIGARRDVSLEDRDAFEHAARAAAESFGIDDGRERLHAYAIGKNSFWNAKRARWLSIKTPTKEAAEDAEIFLITKGETRAAVEAEVEAIRGWFVIHPETGQNEPVIFVDGETGRRVVFDVPTSASSDEVIGRWRNLAIETLEMGSTDPRRMIWKIRTLRSFREINPNSRAADVARRGGRTLVTTKKSDAEEARQQYAEAMKRRDDQREQEEEEEEEGGDEKMERRERKKRRRSGGRTSGGARREVGVDDGIENKSCVKTRVWVDGEKMGRSLFLDKDWDVGVAATAALEGMGKEEGVKGISIKGLAIEKEEWVEWKLKDLREEKGSATLTIWTNSEHVDYDPAEYESDSEAEMKGEKRGGEGGMVV